MIIGYARVSTDGQTLDAQQAALAAAGAERVFAEKISGAVPDRKALARAIAALGPGDVLLVTQLDRLARSTRDLLNVLDAVARAGAGFRSLADTWADTTTPHSRLMLTVLGGLAEFERELIKARTDEGKKRGEGRGREVWEEAKADAASAKGGAGEAGSWRSLGRDCTELRSRSLDHFQVGLSYLICNSAIAGQQTDSAKVQGNLIVSPWRPRAYLARRAVPSLRNAYYQVDQIVFRSRSDGNSLARSHFAIAQNKAPQNTRGAKQTGHRGVRGAGGVPVYLTPQCRAAVVCSDLFCLLCSRNNTRLGLLIHCDLG
jgi:Resolvase, N terminal domain